MIRGALYHGILEAVTIQAKKLIFSGMPPELDFARELLGYGEVVVKRLVAKERERLVRAKVRVEELREIRQNMLKLWRFEANQIAAAVSWRLSRTPRIGLDSLAAHAVPFTIEHRLDGTRVGLSKYLSVDAFQALQPMVLEMKTGRERESHKLGLAGYALALESVYRRPVNFGMLAYVRFPADRPVPYVVRRIYPIDNRLRTQFMRTRDWKLEIVRYRRDPGAPRRCPSTCGFARVCMRKV
jgi:CRISPR-associated protein Csa1